VGNDADAPEPLRGSFGTGSLEDWHDEVDFHEDTFEPGGRDPFDLPFVLDALSRLDEESRAGPDNARVKADRLVLPDEEWVHLELGQLGMRGRDP
jgi:hypothetical protein